MDEELRDFFAWYAERYMASDVHAISAVYEAPLLAVRDGDVIHLPDADAVQGHLSELMAAYARSGATRADIEGMDILPLGPSGAVVTVNWRVRAADGGLVKDFHTTYQLVRDGERWQILSYTNH